MAVTARSPEPELSDVPAGDRVRGGPTYAEQWRALLQLAGFVALALFVGRRWTAQLAPAPIDRLNGAVALSTAVAVLLVVTGRRTTAPWARRALWTATGLATAGALLLISGAGLDVLWVRRWDELAAGLADGLVAMPDLRVPYRGEDEWTRTTLTLGGGLLLLTGGVLVGRRDGRPLAATAVLGLMYAIPMVSTRQEHPFLDGAIFAALAAFLAIGARVPRAQAATAATAGVVALGLAAVTAPQLDGARALVDPENIGARLKSPPTTIFDWDHRYEPLRWPRTGRELLRVRASAPSYWKGVTLERFDGSRWLQSGLVTPGVAPSAGPGTLRGQWRSRVSVTVKELRSQQLYAPGEILEVRRSSARVRPGPGGSFVGARRLLTRGDSYVADVYTPRPTRSELRAASTDYPDSTRSALRIELPARVGGPDAVNPRTGRVDRDRATLVVARPWGTPGGPLRVSTTGEVYDDGARTLEASDYARTWALARRLRDASSSPYDLALRVQRRVRQGATYDERPARARLALDAFLFRSRRGYCQQFSGAMALLLRMGGVPARVASGFAPGRRDASRNEFIITDLDAHSWVEAFFPGLGWVVFDPTPAAAPPITQDDGGATTAAAADIGDLTRQLPSGGGLGDAQDAGGGAAWLVAAAALLGSISLVAVWIGAGHRRRDRGALAAGGPELAELVRALTLTGRTVTPSTTLAQLQQRFASSPDARRYLSAVARARYAGDDGPGPDERRALRRALAAGLGVRGHLRAWWALPPPWPALPRPRRGGLRPGSYTRT